jgi:cystathionine gamma-synthase
LGKLEGGYALTYTSGSSAGFAALNYYRPQRIFIDKGYMGTHSTIQAYFSPLDKQWYNRVFTLKEDILPLAGDLLWLETPKNPNCLLEDIQHYATLAHRAGAHVIVDSTFATPILQQPLKLGADMVMHSCTKFLSGHSDILAGALIVSEKNIMQELKTQRTTTGAVLGSFESFLLLRSLRELDTRIERQVKNAVAVALYLSKNKTVKKVWHPSLESHPGFKLCAKQMKSPPGILSFELETAELVLEFLPHLKLISTATSLGAVHTTIDYRFKWDSKQEPTLLRLSIGIESSKDIIKDLDQALKKLEKPEKPPQ